MFIEVLKSGEGHKSNEFKFIHQTESIKGGLPPGLFGPALTGVQV